MELRPPDFFAGLVAAFSAEAEGVSVTWILRTSRRLPDRSNGR
jgi:hypothetical protein